MRLLLTAIIAATFALPANAAVILNGSFEEGTFGSGPFDTLAAGSGAITGWSIGGAGVDWIGSFWQASDGGRSLDMSALDAGSVAQSLATVAGTRYLVSFDLSGNPGGAPPIKDIDVTVNGIDASTFGYEIGNNTESAMGWLTYSYEFVATGATSVLAFTSLTGTPFGPALDNVRIEALNAVVPEPATWASMILGLGLVGVIGRRRRRTFAA